MEVNQGWPEDVLGVLRSEDLPKDLSEKSGIEFRVLNKELGLV